MASERDEGVKTFLESSSLDFFFNISWSQKKTPRSLPLRERGVSHSPRVN